MSEPEAIKRFHREAKTVTAVRHHHIINLYDFGMYQNQPYLVMDYLEGKSLKDILKDEGALTFERAGKVFEQVLDALASAHESGVVHRDLKPENIMLSKQNNQEDWVTIVDFGLSKNYGNRRWWHGSCEHHQSRRCMRKSAIHVS